MQRGNVVGFAEQIKGLRSRAKLSKAEEARLTGLRCRQGRLERWLTEARHRVAAREAARAGRDAARAAEMRRLGREELAVRLQAEIKPMSSTGSSGG